MVNILTRNHNMGACWMNKNAGIIFAITIFLRNVHSGGRISSNRNSRGNVGSAEPYARVTTPTGTLVLALVILILPNLVSNVPAGMSAFILMFTDTILPSISNLFKNGEPLPGGVWRRSNIVSLPLNCRKVGYLRSQESRNKITLAVFGSSFAGSQGSCISGSYIFSRLEESMADISMGEHSSWQLHSSRLSCKPYCLRAGLSISIAV
ncbi:hypothetical protein Cgig2_000178 [Carnegiea gigantea]|uniref:Uncharacterized protein n=1 Tax=Carnegiea gigantea TaxID=171969 RepID=A0A9Q1KN99_9CARY|nr:hypothetical protein Cgig2_000178 [Carnegiea gigantea]